MAPVSPCVQLATDGVDDQTPGDTSRDFEHPPGNMAVFELENGAFLLICYLKQGSVLVRSGQRVEEGQPIGKRGNSGNSTEPHRHLQRQRPGGSLPNRVEGLPLYFTDHDSGPCPREGLHSVAGG